MEYTLNRIWTIVAMAVVAALAALAVGYPMAAAGVAAGLPVGIINYLMMYRVRQRLGQDGGKNDAALIAQRSMLRLLLSAGALLLAARLGPAFLIGALIGVVLEVFSYFADAVRVFSGRRG